MPSQQYAPANVAPPRQTHPLVDILHQRLLIVLGERSENGGHVCRFRTVEYGYDGLKGEVLWKTRRIGIRIGIGIGIGIRRWEMGERATRTLASSTLGPYGGLSSAALSAPEMSPLHTDRNRDRRLVSHASWTDMGNGERDAPVQRAAHGELFLLGIAQDLGGIAWVGVVELCFLEDVFVVRVDVDLAKGHRCTG